MIDDVYSLSEEDIKLRYITPAITKQGWSVSDISMEAKVKLTDGKINLRGNLVARGKPKVYHGNSLTKDVLNYTDKDKFNVILMNPPYGGNEKNDVKRHFPSDLASSETADLFMVVIQYRLAKDGRAAVILPDGFLFGADNAKLAIKLAVGN